MSARQWRLLIPAPGKQVWGANHDHRDNRWGRRRMRALAKEAAFYAAKQHRVPPLDRVTVAVTIYLRGWANADAHNYPGGSTLKGMVDGLAAAGIVPNDKHITLTGPTMKPLGAFTVPHVELVITPTAAQRQREGEGAA